MNVGQRIKALRLQKNMTLQQVGDAFGITRSAVGSWERGDTRPDQDKLSRLAKLFGTSVEHLLNGNSVPVSTEHRTPIPLHRPVGLPLIDMSEAPKWREKMADEKELCTLERIPCPFAHSQDAFITTVPGHSMYDPTGPKSYSQGDFIAVDPARPAINGSMVLVHKKRTGETLFRQLLIENGKRMVQPLNKKWPEEIESLSDEDSIVGVIIGKWVPE